ncbi:SIS domain-containing protein [Halobacteriota archaeon]
MKISEMLEEGARIKMELREQSAEIEKICERIIKAYENGKKVVLFGNGGSAADAQHIACELVSKFMLERKGLPAIALTTNTSILTAIGNDYGYNNVFSRQVEALVERGDIVIGISTSGSSPNVIKGIRTAKEKGAITIGFIGRRGELAKVVDLCIKVPSSNTPRIQEAHITIGHIICDIVEKELFGGDNE